MNILPWKKLRYFACILFFSFPNLELLKLEFSGCVFQGVGFFCDFFLLENLGQNWLSISKCLGKKYSLILKARAFFFNSYFGSSSSNLKFGREITFESTFCDPCENMPQWGQLESFEKLQVTVVILQTWQAEISEGSVKTLWALNAVQLLMSSAWGVTEHPGPSYNILCHQLAGFQQTYK